MPKANILIVDDKPQNLQLLMNILTQKGYDVRAANSGEAALMTLQAEPSDLVLLDIEMPGLNGYDVCTRLKAESATREIPVLFISARDEVIDKVRAFSVGGVDYITKPFQVEEVLARVETHLALQQTRQNLEESNAELEAFAHTVAHDLKSPLSVITGYCGLTQELAIESQNSQLVELTDITMETAHRMDRIIKELLLLASVRREEVELERFPMLVVVAEVEHRLAQQLESADATLIKPTEWPDVMGVSAWIEEVWVNYISNALKYGEDPPQIELGYDKLINGRIRFWVRDNGVGLTPDEQAQLFTEFTRLDQVRAKGHGLGLSIVKRIMEKIGGQVGVESEIGVGSTFYFTLAIN